MAHQKSKGRRTGRGSFAAEPVNIVPVDPIHIKQEVEDETYFMDHQDSESREGIHRLKDLPFTVKEEAAYSGDHQGTEATHSTAHPTDIPFSIKEEDAYLMDHQSSGVQQILNPGTSAPVITSVFSLHGEESGFFVASEPTERANGHMAIAPVVPVGEEVIFPLSVKEEEGTIPASIKREGDAHFTDSQGTDYNLGHTGQMIITPVVHVGDGVIVPLCVKEEEEIIPASIKQEGDPYSMDNQGTDIIVSHTGPAISSSIVKGEEVSHSSEDEDEEEDEEDDEDENSYEDSDEYSDEDYDGFMTRAEASRTLGLQGYMFEPEYTDEELAAREAQGLTIQTVPDEEDKIQFKDARLLSLESWCLCSACVLMPSLVENFCCREFSPCKKHFADGATLQCITEHPDFTPVCLTPGVLNTLLRLMHELRGHVLPSPQTNRQYRLLAYRAFKWWMSGRPGYKPEGEVRRVIPACVVRRIRERFPVEGGDCTGSESAKEIKDAWKI